MARTLEALQRGLRSEAGIALAALVLGVVLVTLYDISLAPSRYAYSGDSASYIEMAGSLRAEGRPRVTPWDLKRGEPDAVPQPLFPPGFAVAIASLVPLAGDARTAALWPSRIAAALLPFLLVVMWRGAATPATLLGAGLWVLLSPGVRKWQFVAYSDVPTLALAVIALGLLAQGLLATEPDRRTRTWLLAGFVAGIAYTFRNAALALLVAALATLVYARLRSYIGTRPIVLLAAGATVPVGALLAYNVGTFGTSWPYTMPPSARPWPRNLGDYAAEQLNELGIGRLIGASSPGGYALVVLGVLLGVAAFLWWRTRAERSRHVLLTLLGLYAVGGGLLLVMSRSRFEWGNFIDERNVLQYSFALVLAALLAFGALPRGCRRIVGLILVAFLAVRAYAAAREALAARVAPPEEWLALDRDAAVMGVARQIPAGTLIASNAAVLFRIGSERRVRQLDVGGADSDFAGSLAVLAAVAAPGPASFLLVCNEWTGEFSACGGKLAAVAARCTRIRPRDPIVAVCAVEPEEASAGVSTAPVEAAPGTTSTPGAR